MTTPFKDSPLSLDVALRKRRSIRAFLPAAIPEQELQSLLEPALRTASNCNTQPWFLHIASGAVLERLRERLPKDFLAEKLSLDFPYDGKYQDVFRERQHASAHALYGAMGIQRDDKEARQAAFMRNFCFFDAPHVGFFCLPEGFSEREACDLGMFAQSVMLLLETHGLGCCPQTALGFLADSVREELAIPNHQRIMFGLSFGFPDPDSSANTCSTERASWGELIRFHH